MRVQRGVFAGVAYPDDELAGIDGPLVRFLVPVAEGAGVQVESYMLGFAGGHANLFKALQFALGASGFGGGVGDVELGYFSSGHAAGVADVEADRDGRAGGGRRRHFEPGEAEAGVAEPEAEGVERVLAGGGPVAVADHDAVLVLYVGHDVIHLVAVGLGDVQRGVCAGDGGVGLGRGVFSPTAVEADRQLALWVVLAEEDLGAGRAAFLAGGGRLRPRGTRGEPAAGVRAAAAGEGDDGVRIDGGGSLDERVLAPGQLEGAVVALAFGGRVEADGHYRDIGRGGELSGVFRDQVRFQG